MLRVSYKNYRMMGFDCKEYRESIENMNEQIKRLDKKIEEYIKGRAHLWGTKADGDRGYGADNSG